MIDTIVLHEGKGTVRCENKPITFMWKCNNGSPGIFNQSYLRNNDCTWGALSNNRYHVECVVTTASLYYCTHRETGTGDTEHNVLRYINVTDVIGKQI